MEEMAVLVLPQLLDSILILDLQERMAQRELSVVAVVVLVVVVVQQEPRAAVAVAAVVAEPAVLAELAEKVVELLSHYLYTLMVLVEILRM